MLLFSDVLYMLVRYAGPSGPMCLRCLMLTLSGSVDCCFCCLDSLFVLSVCVYGGVVEYFGVFLFLVL